MLEPPCHLQDSTLKQSEPAEIPQQMFVQILVQVGGDKGYKGYKDGLQPKSLADGNWLVKQNQPVSKIETKSDTNLRSLYES
jgi:hypothetical protein